MKEVPENVEQLLYKKCSTPPKVYVGLLWGAALRAKELGDLEKCQKYQLQAVGILTRGIYEGEIKRDEED